MNTNRFADIVVVRLTGVWPSTSLFSSSPYSLACRSSSRVPRAPSECEAGVAGDCRRLDRIACLREGCATDVGTRYVSVAVYGVRCLLMLRSRPRTFTLESHVEMTRKKYHKIRRWKNKPRVVVHDGVLRLAGTNVAITDGVAHVTVEPPLSLKLLQTLRAVFPSRCRSNVLPWRITLKFLSRASLERMNQPELCPARVFSSAARI